ncbi:NADP-specific glutamate dehydrogenase [Marinilabiliaceae bacterium JC017]|nr:NADP-specific glutamate dehydrogenase [Marinilabiliaceae bacterium JC017]
MNIEKYLLDLEYKNPGEPEFLQSLREFLMSTREYLSDDFRLENAAILERLSEPDRVFMFKVPWTNDQGKVVVNRGYRVQYNNALGPYKGGLRFHPMLNLGTVKMLAFEQLFKNSLTSLPMGAAMGGADFDPKGKTEGEIMRFCQSFMLELWDLIGADVDVPGIDLGVGTREIGYLFGMYKKLTRRYSGVFTGKGLEWGGSLIRPEAAGYGIIYFLEALLNNRQEALQGKTITVSGFGNVAWGVISKAVELGAKVITISGPDGYIYDPDGITGEKINYLLEMRATHNDIVRPYSFEFPGTQFVEGKKPWERACDIAIPCAIQNELNAGDARQLVANGCRIVVEGANMPCTPEAQELMETHALTFIPGKAANAGGVAVSGLELAQNTVKLNWTRDEVDARLKEIMTGIYHLCVKHGKQPNGQIDFVKGANVAAFLRVVEAMMDQGVV